MPKKKIKIKQKVAGTNYAICNIADGKNSSRGKIKSLSGGHKSINSNLVGAAQHTFREENTAKNAQSDRTHLNNDIFNIPVKSSSEALERANSIIGDASTKNQFSGAAKVICEDVMLTTSPEYWIRDNDGRVDYNNPENKERLKIWVIENKKFIKAHFDVDNIVYANLQLDETTPHIALMVVNKAPDGTINRKKFGLGDRTKFNAFRNDYYKRMETLSLKKPVENKNADIQSINSFKKALSKSNDQLVQDLSKKIIIEEPPRMSVTQKTKDEYIKRQKENIVKMLLGSDEIQSLYLKSLEQERATNKANTEIDKNNKIVTKGKNIIIDKNNEISSNKIEIEKLKDSNRSISIENDDLKSSLRNAEALNSMFESCILELHRIAPEPFKKPIEQLFHWIKFNSDDDETSIKNTTKSKIKYK